MSISRKKTDLQRMAKEFEALLVDGPGGRHLRAWCRRMTDQGVSPLMVTLSQVVVRSVDGLFVLGKMVREGMTGWLPPCATTEEWEQMYRRPRTTIQRVLDQFVTVPPEWVELLGIPVECGPIGAGTAMRFTNVVLRELQRRDPAEFDQEVREYLQTPEAVETVRRSRALLTESCDRALSMPIGTQFDGDVAEECLGLKEVQFFLLVWLPCWLEYGESASQLLQRAEGGNIEAVEQLLRLDKRAMFFPRIKQLVEAASQNRMEGAFALHAAAFGGLPQTPWKRDVLRIRLTTFILTQSQGISGIHPRLCGRSLTRRDIFEAFHSAARDLGFKRDLTLPVDEEAFCKRITREKRFRTAAAWDIFSA